LAAEAIFSASRSATAALHAFQAYVIATHPVANRKFRPGGVTISL
jgi:hypothetical protein